MTDEIWVMKLSLYRHYLKRSLTLDRVSVITSSPMYVQHWQHIRVSKLVMDDKKKLSQSWCCPGVWSPKSKNNRVCQKIVFKNGKFSSTTLVKERKENNLNDFKYYQRCQMRYSMKYMQQLSYSYKSRMRCVGKQSPLSWAQIISPATAHTLSDKICRRERNSKLSWNFNMRENLNKWSDMPDFVCTTPHTVRYLSDLVCADKIAKTNWSDLECDRWNLPLYSPQTTANISATHDHQ